MTIFPIAPDQTIAQMWSNGVRGACTAWTSEKYTYFTEAYEPGRSDCSCLSESVTTKSIQIIVHIQRQILLKM